MARAHQTEKKPSDNSSRSPSSISRDGGIAKRVSDLRSGKGWTLQAAGEATGIAKSTLSKIERGEQSPTYSLLQKLAHGFDVPVSALFEQDRTRPAAPGRRSVFRAREDTTHYDNPTYEYRVLCGELANKAMLPMVADITALELPDRKDWLSHDGEELIYVLEGTIVIGTEFYEPLTLSAGDAVYFDSSMKHAIAKSEDDELARVLWITCE